MDEHNTKPAPGTSGQNRQPAPVWGGSPEGSGHGAAAHDREFPANQGGGAYETVGQEQPSQGWGTPVEGPRSAGWGTPPANGQVHSGGTGWGAPQQYASTSASRGQKGAWTAKKGLLVGGAAVDVIQRSAEEVDEVEHVAGLVDEPAAAGDSRGDVPMQGRAV